MSGRSRMQWRAGTRLCPTHQVAKQLDYTSHIYLSSQLVMLLNNYAHKSSVSGNTVFLLWVKPKVKSSRSWQLSSMEPLSGTGRQSVLLSEEFAREPYSINSELWSPWTAREIGKCSPACAQKEKSMLMNILQYLLYAWLLPPKRLYTRWS